MSKNSDPILRIVVEVAQVFQVTTAEILLGRRRMQPLATARQLAMTLIYRLVCSNYSWIGRQFNRDHEAVRHALKQIDDLCETDPAFRDIYLTLEKKLKVQLAEAA